MNKELINKISDYLNNKPVEKAWLFGSYSKNEETKKSDIDLLIRFSENEQITLFYYLHLKYELEKLTGKEVDLIEEGQLKDFALHNFKEQNILIYERKTKK